jgi:DNA-directed RNA polymerase II subunit RPB3
MVYAQSSRRDSHALPFQIEVCSSVIPYHFTSIGNGSLGGADQIHSQWLRSVGCECFEVCCSKYGFPYIIRRIMMAEVPTLAIETVTVNENTSVLFDEFIAHRLGLLPINSKDVDKFEYQKDCRCSYSCPNCTVKYSLDVAATDPGVTDVTHHDIQPADVAMGADASTYPYPVPQWDRTSSEAENRGKGINVVKLRQNQQLSIKMEAKKGIGRMHAKFNPTGTVSMRYEPVIEIDRDVEYTTTTNDRREIVNSCPRNVFELDDTEHIEVVRPDQCILCEECVNKANIDLKKPGMVSVSHRTDRVYFDVESTGARPPEDC